MFSKLKIAQLRISFNRKNCENCGMWSCRQKDIGNCWLNDQPFQTKSYQVCQYFRKRYYLPDWEEFQEN